VLLIDHDSSQGPEFRVHRPGHNWANPIVQNARKPITAVFLHPLQTCSGGSCLLFAGPVRCECRRLWLPGDMMDARSLRDEREQRKPMRNSVPAYFPTSPLSFELDPELLPGRLAERAASIRSMLSTRLSLQLRHRAEFASRS